MGGYLSYMSPGLFALGPGKFSHSGVTEMTFTLVIESELRSRQAADGRTGAGVVQWPRLKRQRPQLHLYSMIKTTTKIIMADGPMSPRISFISCNNGGQL